MDSPKGQMQGWGRTSPTRPEEQPGPTAEKAAAGPQDEGGGKVRRPRAWRRTTQQRKAGFSPGSARLQGQDSVPGTEPTPRVPSSSRSHATALIDFRQRGRESERQTPTGCLPSASGPGIAHETQVCALARDGTHDLLIYGAMLQLTGPPGQGSPPPKSPRQPREPQPTSLGPAGLGGGAGAVTTLTSFLSSSPGGALENTQFKDKH